MSEVKFPDLKREIYIVAKNNDFDATEVYGKFDHFKAIYPDLKYSTFERNVRFVCNDPKLQEGIKSEDEERDNFISKLDKIKISSFEERGNYKRIVVLSDLHSGHMMGLTPPSWHWNLDNIERHHVARIQKEAWDWYCQAIDNVGANVDILVINGDLIDGRGERSGSTELITTDRRSQISIGVEAVNMWNADKIFMTRGTPYHNGVAEQFEDLAAERLNAVIDDVLDIRVNGKIFNFKHKVGNSSVPYGKATQVNKEGVINQLVANYNDQPSADVIVRSHVHYMHINRDGSRWSMTTPALQVNSRYGKQQCSGITDFGFIVIDVYDNGDIDVKPYLANLQNNKSMIIDV